MSVIRKLELLMGLNTAAFDKKASEAEKTAKAAGDKIRGHLSTGFAVAGAGAGIAAVGIGLVGAKLTQMTAASLETIDTNAKLADVLNTSTENLLGLQHAANLSGTSADDLGTALKKMTVTLGDAANDPENNPLAKTLKGLGLSAKQLAMIAKLMDEKAHECE